MKIPYKIKSVAGREWHKIYIIDNSGDFENGRISRVENKLKSLTGDYMVKHTTLAFLQRRLAILVAEDEDFLFLTLTFNLRPYEIKGKKNWFLYRPRRRGIYGQPRSMARDPSPMAE